MRRTSRRWRKPGPDRRTFLAGAAATLAGGMLPRRASSAASSSTADLDPQLLVRVANVVLPDLSAATLEHAVEHFLGWLSDYDAERERERGTGKRPRQTRAALRRSFAADLEALRATALAKHRRAFEALDHAAQEALVRDAIAHAAPDALTVKDAALSHVAVALMSVYYRTPEAHNLCFEAAIDPATCRGLGTVKARPARL